MGNGVEVPPLLLAYALLDRLMELGPTNPSLSVITRLTTVVVDLLKTCPNLQ